MSPDSLDHLAGELRGRLAAGEGDPRSSPGDRIDALIADEASLLDPDTRVALTRRLTEQTLGLGPLQPLLDDETVDEVLVGAGGTVWVERRGRLEQAEMAFETETALRDVIERLLAPTGRRVDEATPLADARLADGSRVNVVLPPLAVDGPALTIRRFRRSGFTGEDLVNGGTLSEGLLGFLARAIRARLNVLVCGGTGSGKTTTLNVLSSFAGATERIVTIEDAAELRLTQPHVVRLEARPPSLEGRGEVTIRALVKNALRMRPDRLIVGEVRGPEALDMLQALATGHDGSLCTVHAGSANEALRRLETLSLMAGLGLPHEAIRTQVAHAIDLVVCQARIPGGGRAIVEVGEVIEGDDGGVVRPLFRRRDGRDRIATPTSALAARLALADEAPA